MNTRQGARGRGYGRQAEPSGCVGDAKLKGASGTFALPSARVVCPCGCIFQAVGEFDECWTCGRTAGAIKAEQDRIVASIRGLPELDPPA
jgi:hypothetical protein